jgi:hypothetical protein
MPYYIIDLQDNKCLTPLCLTKEAAQEALMRRKPSVIVCPSDMVFKYSHEKGGPWQRYGFVEVKG